jgi:hypothetical protein
MSDPLRVTCACGYENWVPAEKLGQTVPCFVCGQDLLIEEPAASLESPGAGARPAGAGERPSTSAAPLSPFEADEPDTAVRPKFQHAPPAPVLPSPAPRPRSPFEEDAPEEERILRADEKLVAGPFSLEAAPAPKEGPSVSDQMEKLRPKERRDRHMIVHTISPHDAPTGEKCSQCGKELRGSWDRIETEAGLLCYVCSNQATHDVPARLLKADTSPKREARDTEFITASGPAEPVEYVPWWRDTHSDGFKNAILFLAFGTLFFAFIVWLTGWGSPPTNSPTNAASDTVEGPPLPAWITYGVWTWRILASYLGLFIALYLTLGRDGRLPYDSFRTNVLYLCGVIGLFTGVAIGALLGGYLVGGGIWVVGIAAIAVLTTLSILTNLLDFRFRDFLWLVFFYLPVSQFIVYVLSMFVYWGLYELAA